MKRAKPFVEVLYAPALTGTDRPGTPPHPPCRGAPGAGREIPEFADTTAVDAAGPIERSAALEARGSLLLLFGREAGEESFQARKRAVFPAKLVDRKSAPACFTQTGQHRFIIPFAGHCAL